MKPLYLTINRLHKWFDSTIFQFFGHFNDLRLLGIGGILSTESQRKTATSPISSQYLGEEAQLAALQPNMATLHFSPTGYHQMELLARQKVKGHKNL